MLALVGRSGSGKTTTLRGIAGLWRPDSGRIDVGGARWLDTGSGICLPAHRRRVGVVFQSYGLFPHMTAEGNVIAAAGSSAAHGTAPRGRAPSADGAA